eukprot:3272889-Alexandrium_andersonii.AAC.1
MSASLVGSEMCIRDRGTPLNEGRRLCCLTPSFLPQVPPGTGRVRMLPKEESFCGLGYGF